MLAFGQQPHLIGDHMDRPTSSNSTGESIDLLINQLIDSCRLAITNGRLGLVAPRFVGRGRHARQSVHQLDVGNGRDSIAATADDEHGRATVAP